MVTDWQEEKVYFCEKHGCPAFSGDITDKEEVEAYLDEHLNEAENNWTEHLKNMEDLPMYIEDKGQFVADWAPTFADTLMDNKRPEDIVPKHTAFVAVETAKEILKLLEETEL